MWNRNACIPDIDQIHSNPGSRVHDLLEPRFDGEVTRLVKTGEEDIQDRIEAAAPFTDLNYMLHRLSLGDRSVLNTRTPIYGDFSALPRDPIEALNLVQRSEDAFKQLPADVRANYNNDWQRWFAAVLSGDASRENISTGTSTGTSGSPSVEVNSVETV